MYDLFCKKQIEINEDNSDVVKRGSKTKEEMSENRSRRDPEKSRGAIASTTRVVSSNRVNLVARTTTAVRRTWQSNK